MAYNYDLGSHHRSITTVNAEAQQWFDRGLMWIYGFDLEMAGRCFREAIALDDNCAMAWWGVSLAAGPQYNHAVMNTERTAMAWISFSLPWPSPGAHQPTFAMF